MKKIIAASIATILLLAIWINYSHGGNNKKGTDLKNPDKVMYYEIAHGDDISKLADEVNRQINLGWQPIGGFCVTPYSEPATNKTILVATQAMVKYQ